MEEQNEVQEVEMVTVPKADWELLGNAVLHYKEKSEMAQLEIEELKKPSEPQSVTIEGLDLEELRETLLPKVETLDDNEDEVFNHPQY